MKQTVGPGGRTEDLGCIRDERWRHHRLQEGECGDRDGQHPKGGLVPKWRRPERSRGASGGAGATHRRRVARGCGVRRGEQQDAGHGEADAVEEEGGGGERGEQDRTDGRADELLAGRSAPLTIWPSGDSSTSSGTTSGTTASTVVAKTLSKVPRAKART